MIKYWIAGGFSLLMVACMQPEKTPVDYVDPFIGTGFHGHTYPGATTPFGAVQLSPDTRRGNWDACSGYYYSDHTLMGFSHTHLSGTGCIDLGDLLFRPSRQDALVFDHTDETASPGYYRVRLPEAGVTVELTATTHAGIHRYTWDQGKEQVLTVDLAHLLDNETIHEIWLKQTAPDELAGMRRTSGWVENQSIYFVAQFSRPFQSAEWEVDDSSVVPDPLLGTATQVTLLFDGNRNEPLVCKVGLSIVSIENARLNLETETGTYGYHFDDIRQSARSQWATILDAMTIEGATQAQKTVFYTALYHSLITPNQVSDVNGQYRCADNTIGQTPEGRRQYATFSTWDTFRAWHPMMTLMDTTRVNDMINSLLNIYDVTGELPLWPLSSGETNTMIGYHSASIIADAYLKGIRGYDVEKAFEAMKVSAKKNKKGAAEYIRSGFIPANSKKESVSCLLEFAYDDWCIARMAKALGHDADYDTFIHRSQNYANVFDGATRFFRGKRSDGNWETPFDSFAIGRSYTEATAWQYRFFVPHDVYGMTQLFGGREQFTADLDSLFTVSSEIAGEMSDVTGLIGQYAHGNEPSHHMAYLYSYIGQPWKTQEWTRRLLHDMYQPTPEGIIGNEDCGQMSAWYILSSLGFYSVCPGSNQFVLTAPLHEKATLRLANGRQLTITANQPAKHTYIDHVSLNGQPITSCYITYEQLMEGGTLDFTLTSRPNKQWGTAPEDAPYSFSSEPIVSVPTVTGDLDLFEGETEVCLVTATEGAEIRYTLDGSEPTGQSPLFTTPFTLRETTTIQAKAFKAGYLASRTFTIQARKAVLRPALVLSGLRSGVAYIYVEGYFRQTADLATVPVKQQGFLPEPSITGALQADHFGYTFSGYLYAPEDGVYLFSTRSDDGSVLFIGAEKVVDNDASHAAINATGRIALAKGYHPFKLLYFEDYEGEELSWGWSLPGSSELTSIPVEYLFINEYRTPFP